MDYRTLDVGEVALLVRIDRSERIEEVYRLQRGELVLHREPCTVTGFDPAELAALVARQQRIVAGGGKVLGAFEGEQIAGMASVERRLRGAARDQVKMDVLYVGAPFRGRGVGRALVRWAMDAAREMGAAALYVSATPTRRTVEFYLGCGARIAPEPDAELVALEPDDIHLELRLPPR